METDGTDLEPKPAWSTAAANVGVVAVVLSGAAKGRTARLGNGITIGAAEDNGLVLADRMVSRRHCELVRTAQGIRVVDLESTNGTFVNGVRVEQVTAAVGAVIRVGQVEIALRPKAEQPALPPSEKTSFGFAVGQSLAMRRIFGVLEYVAPSNATVLLTGPTGTGKDVLARSIAERSGRSGPFVVVDCGAVARGVLESELFGHERGAFTGALSTRKGAFELAAKGTLFLDEIGELPVDMQPKLLRVIEAREYRRVGGSKTMQADVRIIAATRRDLEAEVTAGRFREDLFFRLAVVPLEVAPLRERREDIPLLVDGFLAAWPGLTASAGTMAELVAGDWPGNVRELRNVLERAAILARAEGRAELVLSNASRDARAPAPSDASFRPGESYEEARRSFERVWLAELLAAHGGDLAAAARAGGLDEARLAQLLDEAGITARGGG